MHGRHTRDVLCKGIPQGRVARGMHEGRVTRATNRGGVAQGVQRRRVARAARVLPVRFCWVGFNGSGAAGPREGTECLSPTPAGVPPPHRTGAAGDVGPPVRVGAGGYGAGTAMGSVHGNPLSTIGVALHCPRAAPHVPLHPTKSLKRHFSAPTAAWARRGFIQHFLFFKKIEIPVGRNIPRTSRDCSGVPIGASSTYGCRAGTRNAGSPILPIHS